MLYVLAIAIVAACSLGDQVDTYLREWYNSVRFKEDKNDGVARHRK